MTALFRTEQALVNPLQQRDRQTLFCLGFASLIGAIAPIVFSGQLPTPIKTASLFCGVGTSAAAAVISGNKIARKQNKYAQIIDRAQEDSLLTTMEGQIAHSKMINEVYTGFQAYDLVKQLPEEMQGYWARYFGIEAMIADEARTIAVEAQAILETTEAAPYAQTVRSIGSGAVATKAYSEAPELPFDEEDLALTLAQTTIDPNEASSTLIACPRGTGKSTLLRQAIFYAHTIHEGAIDFSVFAGKDGETYCGLEQAASEYLYSGSKDNVFETYRRLEAITSARCETFAGFPTVQILDEYNNTLASAEVSDKLNKDNKCDLISATTYERITKGRSKLVLDWITSHSPLVQDVDLNKQIQNSIFTIILARGSSYGTIEDALANRIKIVDNATRREELRQKLADYRNSPRFDRKRVVALTNVLDDWRLVFVPIYGETEEIDRGALNQSGEEIEQDLEASQAQPQNKPGSNAFEAMQQWLDDLHRLPSDAEIVAQFRTLTGRILDDSGLRLMKEHLGLNNDDSEESGETEVW